MERGDAPIGRATLAAVVSTAACVLCAVLLLLGVIGISSIKEGQRDMLALLTEDAATDAMMRVSYTDAKGDPHVVEVHGAAGEDESALAQRLMDALTESEKKFPRRR